MLYRFQRSFQTRKLLKIIPFHLADIGEGIKECEVLQWYVKEGDMIEEFDKLCEVQSDKAAVEITSRYTGKVVKLYQKPGEVVQVGNVLVDIDSKADETAKVEKAEPKEVLNEPVPPEIKKTLTLSENYEKVKTTPSVRRLAREMKIDLTTVKPTGKNGRIMRSDVESHGSTAKVVNKEERHSSTIYNQNAIQKAMFKAMTASNSIPRFGYTDYFQLNLLEQQRKQINLVLESQNIKLSYMPFLVKAFGVACLEFPTLNSTLKQDVVYNNSFVNIGIAMDTPNGLMVPSIKNVQEKSILEIHAEMQSLLQKAKLNKLTMADISDTTITLSNIGTIGGLWVHPVVPMGTTTIIGLGKSHYVQDPESATPSIVKVMPLSLSADHRIVDGATSAKFIQSAKGLLSGALLAYLK